MNINKGQEHSRYISSTSFPLFFASSFFWWALKKKITVKLLLLFQPPFRLKILLEKTRNFKCKSWSKSKRVTIQCSWPNGLLPPGIKKHLLSKYQFYQLQDSINSLTLKTCLVSLLIIVAVWMRLTPHSVMQTTPPTVILEEIGKLPTNKEKRKPQKEQHTFLEIRVWENFNDSLFFRLIKLPLWSLWQASGNQMAN